MLIVPAGGSNFGAVCCRLPWPDFAAEQSHFSVASGLWQRLGSQHRSPSDLRVRRARPGSRPRHHVVRVLRAVGDSERLVHVERVLRMADGLHGESPDRVIRNHVGVHGWVGIERRAASSF